MIEVITIGASAGGMQALRTIISALPADFSPPIAVVQHVGAKADSYMIEYLSRASNLRIKEAEDKEPLSSGTIYIAPRGYHLLIEPNRTCSLSVDGKVNFSCPAIDVLFESAADALQESLAGVILTGANSDGSRGLKAIKRRGGLAIVQNPKTAEVGYMPQAALEVTAVDYVVELDQIAPLLLKLSTAKEAERRYDTASDA